MVVRVIKIIPRLATNTRIRTRRFATRIIIDKIKKAGLKLLSNSVKLILTFRSYVNAKAAMKEKSITT